MSINAYLRYQLFDQPLRGSRMGRSAALLDGTCTAEAWQGWCWGTSLKMMGEAWLSDQLYL